MAFFSALRKSDKYLHLRGSLRAAPLIRVICWPGMALLRRVQEQAYWRTEHSAYIQSLKDTHVGERCFIVGNGPSLTVDDLEAIKDEDSFAANRIYNMFDKTSWRPTYLVVFDKDMIEQEMETFTSLPLPCIFLDKVVMKKCGRVGSNVHFFNKDRRFHVKQYSLKHIYYSDEVDKRVCGGDTVTYVAMQFALYMGYREIYLIGVDHTYSHTIDSHGVVSIKDGIENHYYKESKESFFNYQFKEGAEYAYSLARNAAEAVGGSIINATRGGALEIFKRANLDNVLARIKEGE